MISVIVAVYNGVTTICRCLDSVLGQHYPNIELIVIDGGSKDGTAEMIASYASRLTYWLSEVDSGIANAWNKGVARATGEWVIFLGADDYLWNGSALAWAAERLSRVPDACLVAYCDVMGVDVAGRHIRKLTSPWNRKKFFGFSLYFSQQGIFHRNRCFELFGVFDESFKLALDYEFLLRCVQKSEPIYLPGATVAAMQLGGISNKPRNSVHTLLEAMRARRIHGGSVGSPLYFRALVGAIGRFCIAEGSKRLGRQE